MLTQTKNLIYLAADHGKIVMQTVLVGRLVVKNGVQYLDDVPLCSVDIIHDLTLPSDIVRYRSKSKLFELMS